MSFHVWSDVGESALPPVPEWGTLALDIYLLREWDSPHPQPHADSEAETKFKSPDQRRRRLVRQFLDRPPESDTAESLERVYPTESQIETILHPLCPDSIRRFAYPLSIAGEGGLWVRTIYGAEADKVHSTIWQDFVENGMVLGPDAIVLDDEELFANADITRVMEIFLEWAVGNDWKKKWAGKVLAEVVEECKYWENDAVKEDGERESAVDIQTIRRRGRERDPNYLCEQYWEYHVACIHSYLFVEDAVTHETGESLLVYLDDCGNMVRQERRNAEEADNFFGSWHGGNWKDGLVGPGTLGEVYQIGGARGPPYW
ncbi:uncharacterized protein BDV17DRAFT_295128 [Aspergillus undulatus]|uniref:uncharacterized protein n=1 Tax=Aspergillus undulatus TaxID=1810928 RepID=UPI003CCD0653